MCRYYISLYFDMSVAESLRCYISKYLEKTSTIVIDHVKYETQNVAFQYRRRHFNSHSSETSLQSVVWTNQTTGEFKPQVV